MQKILKVLLCLLPFLGHGGLYAQAVTTDTYFPNGENEFTIIFDLKQAQDTRAAGLLGKTSDIFLWSGAGTADNAFEFQPTGQTNFSVPFEMGRMTSLGNDRWSIKLKPRDYFKVPIGKFIKNWDFYLKVAMGKHKPKILFWIYMMINFTIKLLSLI